MIQFIPFLHLAGRNVNAFCLTATAHSEVNIKGRKALSEVTLGNNIECSGMVEDVGVKSEITA